MIKKMSGTAVSETKIAYANQDGSNALRLIVHFFFAIEFGARTLDANPEGWQR